MSKKQIVMRAWAGFSRLKSKICSTPLWIRPWIIGFHDRQEVSWSAKRI